MKWYLMIYRTTINACGWTVSGWWCFVLKGSDRSGVFGMDDEKQSALRIMEREALGM